MKRLLLVLLCLAGSAQAADPEQRLKQALKNMDAAPTPCTMDSECPGGFCRPTMGGGMACHPFAEEGDLCGGSIA